MICLWLSHAEAGALVDALDAGDLRLKLQRTMAADLLPDDGVPRTVVLRSEGDGLRVAAVQYDDATAADAAWDTFWRLAQQPPEPPRTRSRPRVTVGATS